MSTQTTYSAAPLGSITTFRVVHAFERAVAFVTRWREARATRRVLARLSDSQLEDIGLVRGQIYDIR